MLDDMAVMNSQSQWYLVDGHDQCLDPAREAFSEAIAFFNSSLSQDVQKRALVSKANTIADVEELVFSAKRKYETSQKDTKASKWLSKLSKRIRFYGNIMDVLVQHHPEYVSLVWGVSKMLFVLVENHEKMVASLAKGLSQIADCLPRIGLATILYPTKRLKQAVAELYAHIMRYFIRAMDWYSEGKLRRAWDSFSRPVEIRYADLIENIEGCTKEVDSLAAAGAQAEQRDIHLEIQGLTRSLLEMRQIVTSYQSLNSSAHLNTSQQLTDIQLNQIMDYVSGASIQDAMEALHYCAFMRNRRQSSNRLSLRPAQNSNYQFWLTPKFNTWKWQQSSALILVKGDYLSRFQVKDFGVAIIELLRKSKVPVIWTLKSLDQDRAQALSVIDVLKNLVNQALRLNISSQTEGSLSLSCARFRGAQTEEEWFNLLTSVVACLPQLYIIIDVETVSAQFAQGQSGFSWLSGFSAIFRNMSAQGIKTILKVVLVSYGSASFQDGVLAKHQDLVIPVRQKFITAQSSKGQTSLALRDRRSRGGQRNKDLNLDL